MFFSQTFYGNITKNLQLGFFSISVYNNMERIYFYDYYFWKGMKAYVSD